MHRIAPTEKDTPNAELENRLWDAADQFRANSGLKSQEYSARVRGLTLPCTLWFLDKSKSGSAAFQRRPKSGTGGNSSLPDRSDTVLFTDARHIYRQMDARTLNGRLLSGQAELAAAKVKETNA